MSIIHKLGNIPLPDYIYQDILAEPNRMKSQVGNTKNILGWKDPEQISEADRPHADTWYTDLNCYSEGYMQDHYRDIVPESFLREHGLMRPVSALIRRLRPGRYFAPHMDCYHNLVFPVAPDAVESDIRRLWIPMHDWRFGQALFVGDTVLSQWQRGDVYWFDGTEYHSACNAGLETRYILVVYTLLNRKS